jgi:hypothetical protein
LIDEPVDRDARAGRRFALVERRDDILGNP